MKNIPSLGIQIPDILLPKNSVDLQKWAVIACDQFTSQPEYWQQVASIVGENPSTFHITLPEIFLGKPEEALRLQSTQSKMREYLDQGIFVPHQGMIYVERTVEGRTRRGLMLALDLEQYDFSKGSQSPIRATEGTILDRLPPRMKIREKASVEIPHILVLIDDPEDSVIGPVEQARERLPILYNFDLMLSSGHLTGRAVDSEDIESRVIGALNKLSEPEAFYTKYSVTRDHGVLLFAVGDGNHSLATAKSIWEKIKSEVGMDHPARYALVEVENIHDRGLDFAPIHRVLFNLNVDPFQALQRFFGSRVSVAPVESRYAMFTEVNNQSEKDHQFGMITASGLHVVSVTTPVSTLPVGTLQEFLDSWLKSGEAGSIDYVHGDDVVCDLGSQKGNAGFYLPAMAKGQLFKTVIVDGALPRKTFSMGEAHEKRFYFEARQIA